MLILWICCKITKFCLLFCFLCNARAAENMGDQVSLLHTDFSSSELCPVVGGLDHTEEFWRTFSKLKGSYCLRSANCCNTSWVVRKLPWTLSLPCANWWMAKTKEKPNEHTVCAVSHSYWDGPRGHQTKTNTERQAARYLPHVEQEAGAVTEAESRPLITGDKGERLIRGAGFWLDRIRSSGVDCTRGWAQILIIQGAFPKARRQLVCSFIGRVLAWPAHSPRFDVQHCLLIKPDVVANNSNPTPGKWAQEGKQFKANQTTWDPVSKKIQVCVEESLRKKNLQIH